MDSFDKWIGMQQSLEGIVNEIEESGSLFIEDEQVEEFTNIIINIATLANVINTYMGNCLESLEGEQEHEEEKEGEYDMGINYTLNTTNPEGYTSEWLMYPKNQPPQSKFFARQFKKKWSNQTIEE